MIISYKTEYLAKIVLPVNAGMQIFFIFIFVLSHVGTSHAFMVKSKGYGTIVENDVTQARDEAIIDAKISAIESSLGLHIFSRVNVEDGILLYDKVERVVNGYVSNYTIVDEKKRDNIYEVSIMANIIKQEIEEHKKNSSFPILLFLKIENEIESSESIIPLVGNAFREAGFNAINSKEGEATNFVALFNVVITNENEINMNESKVFWGLDITYELTIKNQISRSVICYFNGKGKGFSGTKIGALKNALINSKSIVEKAFHEMTGDGISKKIFISSQAILF
jgi:hypothetical protein